MIPSTPTPQIFERLRVTDGLLIDRERWQLAHNYHRQRQNLHYQSLQQPGIVCGLGVASIAAPAEIPSTYKDDRWIELQPGIAIDLLGNPIVVTEPMPFRVSSEAPKHIATSNTIATGNPPTVYIVLRYVDPDGLDGQGGGDRVRETFRIDEVARPPLEHEIEVCRLSLSADPIRLSDASNVFAPELNQIDLRFRPQASARSLGEVRVACIADRDDDVPACYRSASGLLRALPTLYPELQGDQPQVIRLPVNVPQTLEFDLAIGDYRQLKTLNPAARTSLKQYLDAGGVLLVMTQAQGSIDELADLEFKLETAIAETHSRDELGDIQQQLTSELQAVQRDLETRVLELRLQLEQSLGYSLAPTAAEPGVLNRDHLLRNQPFAFGHLPSVGHRATQLYQWRGVVLSIGGWIAAWGPDDALMLGRNCIRDAQELGVNLLHFAWRRRQLTQLQHSSASGDHPLGSALSS